MKKLLTLAIGGVFVMAMVLGSVVFGQPALASPVAMEQSQPALGYVKSLNATGRWSSAQVSDTEEALAGLPTGATLEEQVLQIIRSHPEVILESVQAYQQRQRQEQEERQRAAVKELVAHPQKLIGASPKRGSSQQILLVEFSDFQCPFCAKAHSDVKQFVDRHSQEMTLVYKHFPLTQIHSEAMPAAKAAWAAGQQGKFWDYHDALFEQQKSLGEDLYISLAEQLGLNVEKFNRDRMGAAASRAIQQDIDLAEKLEIGGTPFFVINGEVLSGAVSLAEFERQFAKVVSERQH